MGKFRDSRTARNLLTSYAFESQATTRYIFYSVRAKEEGFAQISAIFKEIADQECEHALRFFKFFNGGDMEITARFFTGALQNTGQNLHASAALENHVHTDLYPGFAAVARDEGFQKAADFWDAISIAEEQHEKTFRALVENMETDRLFRRDTPLKWRCRNCGYIHNDTAAPEKCPACVRPTGFFELFVEAW